MPFGLGNPLRGSWKPGPLARRLTDFLLSLVAIIFIAMSRRIFAWFVRRNTGLRETRMVPDSPRRIAFALYCSGTLFLFLTICYMVTSEQSSALWAGAASTVCYVLTGLVLRRVALGLPVVFGGHGRLAEIFRRTWEVIRNGLP